MRRLDYLLSYLHPIPIETTSSPINPVLEIVFYAGKYSLNSQNTNYSHGSLQTLFKKLFRKLNLNWQKIDDILILGFGTGSIVDIIANYRQDCAIEGVEIDKKIIELGEKYFNNDSLKKTTIHCTSAEQFLEDCKRKYDLIIIDVYIDLRVPESVETKQFMELVKNALKREGIVVFNKYIYSKASREHIPILKSLFENTFENVVVMTIMVTGKIFISRKLNEK